MDKRIYLLTIVTFVVGMVELIIGGILDLVADDLHLSIQKAGFLITIYSLVFAIASPVLLTVTAKIERKKLTLITLTIFLFGNILAVMAPSFTILLLARVVAAASGSLLVVLCITIASGIATDANRGRAIGVVLMGVSGSLVFGIPVGLMLGNAYGWRAPFVLITILTIIAMIGVSLFMTRMDPKPVLTIREQLKTLRSRPIIFAQFTSYLFLAAHLTLYGYLTPFLKTVMHLNGTWVSIIYLIFGIAAITGSHVGGTLTDKIGTKKAMISIIIIYGLSYFMIPHTIISLSQFTVVMIIWSMMSWAIAPTMQSYLVEKAPETSDIQQSLNNTALHLGIASGSLIGGVVIEQSSVIHNATIGGFMTIFTLITAVISMVSVKQLKKTRKVS